MESAENPQPKNDRRTCSDDVEAWNRFLALLNPDRNLAAVEYERVRQTFVAFFRSRRCWDPEQCADQTIDRTVRRIGEVRCLIPFMRGVARYVALEFARSRQIQPGINQLNLLVSTPVYSDDNVIHEQHLIIP